MNIEEFREYVAKYYTEISDIHKRTHHFYIQKLDDNILPVYHLTMRSKRGRTTVFTIYLSQGNIEMCRL